MYRMCAFICTINVAVTVSEDPWILHTNVATIERLELDTWSSRSLIQNQTGVIAVDYHYTRNSIYWADQLDDRIQRANLLNPTVTEDIHTSGLDRADTVAVDWIYDHLYWIDSSHSHIVMSKLDGKLRKTIIKDNLAYPRGLVVHPLIGWIFFSDIHEPKIEKCGLDGSGRTVLVSSSTTNLDDPNGLALDFDASRLYWIDNIYKEIRSCNFDGTDIRLLVQSPDYMPWAWGLALYKEWIYWTNFNNNSIGRVDKATGSNIGFIKTGLSQPVGIKVVSPDNQPSGTNLCVTNNAACDHLCIASPLNTTSCACADGFQLKSDGHGCQNIGSGVWLTYANLKTIERLDMTTNVTQTIAKGITNAVDIDVHYEKGFVYWTDVQAHKILRSRVTEEAVSNEIEDIITNRIITPDGIAVDWMYDLLYWSDTGYDHIQVSRLDGKNIKTIVQDGSLDQPRAIAVDPNSGLLFFSDWGIFPRIERCRMDGADRSVIVSTNVVWPNGMSIDYTSKRLYWIDGKLSRIESVQFDGTGRSLLIESTIVLPKPFDLVVYGSKVYWSNWQNKTIYSLNKNIIKDFRVVSMYLRSPMGIMMYGEGIQQEGLNVCGNNGGCSHICFPLPTPGMTSSISNGCMCPDEYTLASNNKTCLLPGQTLPPSTEDPTSSTGISTRSSINSISDKQSVVNYTAIIVGASLGGVILIFTAIFIGVYCKRLQKKNKEQRQGEPNSAYQYIVEGSCNDESQSTINTYVEPNPYETLRTNDPNFLQNGNIYDEVQSPMSDNKPTGISRSGTNVDTNPYLLPVYTVGTSNALFAESNPRLCKPLDPTYIEPVC